MFPQTKHNLQMMALVINEHLKTLRYYENSNARII
jgi:hypothetical protein